nr:hypothetical protein BaRGS_003937 [Batillaria attramentaria]
MVAENPTLAASRAFASIEIPVDLLDTTSKRLKKIFGPVIMGGEIRLVLYFESGSRSSQNEASESAILQVLASSAPRVGQTENGVVSINNVHVNLTSAAIDVEETTEVPEFVNTGGDVSGWHPVSRVALSSTTVAPGRQTTGTANSRTMKRDYQICNSLQAV